MKFSWTSTPSTINLAQGDPYSGSILLQCSGYFESIIPTFIGCYKYERERERDYWVKASPLRRALEKGIVFDAL